MSAFLRLLGAFLAIALTDTILVCLATIAAFAIANAMMRNPEPELRWDQPWPQIRQTVEAKP